MPARPYVNEYIDAQNVDNFSTVPAKFHSAIAKRCMNLIHMNRGAKKIALDRNDPANAAQFAEIQFALDTLWKLGYRQEMITVEKGTIIWRRIRRDPIASLGYALLKCSQKLETTRKYRIMYVLPPLDADGNETLTDSFFRSIYISGNTWYFAETGGCPWVIKTDDFNPWDAPYPTYKLDGIIVEKEQDPNH